MTLSITVLPFTKTLFTVPPEAVSDLKKEGVTSTNASIEWLCPPDTGRDDTIYKVCATNSTDFSKHCYDEFSAPERDPLGYATYVLKDLKPFTTYIVTVCVANGVSEQDSENDDRRVTQVILVTGEGGTL